LRFRLQQGQPLAAALGSGTVAAGLTLVIASVPAGAQQNRNLERETQNPGRLLEQREREERFYGPRDELESDEPDLDVDELEDGKLPEDSGETFVLQGVRFNQSAFIDDARLRELADRYVGEEVRFADINELVDEINAIYRERGQITARAVVPPQRIEGGILRIRLVEGETGAVELRGRTYTDADFLRSAVGLETGQTIDVPAMQRRLRGINRLTRLQLGAQLQAGEEFGQSDVLIDVEEPPRWTGRVFVDNNGAKSTGEEQAGAVGTWNGPLARADRLTGLAVGSEGAVSVSGTYSVPVLPRGDLFTVQASYGETDIVDGGFEDFDIEGESTRLSAEYLMPGFVGRNWSVDALADASYVSSETDALGDPIADTEIVEFGVGLQARGGGERLRWFVEQRFLYGNSQNILNETNRFGRFPGRLSFVSPGVFGGAIQLTGSWQLASKERIASPSEFTIGGVGTVRGYDNGVQAAANGGALSLEHHWRPDWYVDPYVFFDIGFVDQVRGENEAIRSVGTGFNWEFQGFRVNAAVAHTLDTDVAPDQSEFRAHIRLTYAFGASD
jgi:hemolysin activation/secretion protein